MIVVGRSHDHIFTMKPAQVAHHATAHAAAKSSHHAAAATHATAHAVQGKASPYINLVQTRGATIRGLSQAAYQPNPGSFSPSAVAKAYGVDLLGLANQGQGVTIGIVDEYHDPNILADTNKFSAQYGLPAMTTSTLTVYKDTDFGSVPTGSGVDVETSLDVEWAHAMAPKAKILLVEVPATGNGYNVFAELLHGVQYAASQPGVSSISLSYGYPEFLIGNVAALSKQYLATGAAFNVPVMVSSGDYELPLFPSTSPNVISVGGTALRVKDAAGTYKNEAAWGGEATSGAGGGGYSSTFASPLFQSNNGVNFVTRTIPDVSAIADPYTGVSVYDSFGIGNGNPWSTVGGTSLASPVFAGIVALAQQDRIAANKPILNSTQINNLLYQTNLNPADYAKYFNDITLGNNNDTSGNLGYITATGYDLATGLGSVKANTVVPYLAGA